MPEDLARPNRIPGSKDEEGEKSYDGHPASIEHLALRASTTPLRSSPLPTILTLPFPPSKTRLAIQTRTATHRRRRRLHRKHKSVRRRYPWYLSSHRRRRSSSLLLLRPLLSQQRRLIPLRHLHLPCDIAQTRSHDIPIPNNSRAAVNRDVDVGITFHASDLRRRRTLRPCRRLRRRTLWCNRPACRITLLPRLTRLNSLTTKHSSNEIRYPHAIHLCNGDDVPVAPDLCCSVDCDFGCVVWRFLRVAVFFLGVVWVCHVGDGEGGVYDGVVGGGCWIVFLV